MRNLLTVVAFTMKEMVKRKSFIVSTLIILVLIVIGFNVPNILKAISGEDYTEKILISDSENIFEGNLGLLKEYDLGYELQIENKTYEEIKEKIENEEIEAAIIIKRQDNNVKIRYVVEDTTLMEGVPEELVSSINSLYTNLQINKLGLTTEQLQSITPNFEFSLEQTEEQEAKGNIFTMLMFLCLSSFKFYNYRKNIKNNGNTSNLDFSNNNSIRKDYRNWNSRLTTNEYYCSNSINICKYFFRI